MVDSEAPQRLPVQGIEAVPYFLTVATVATACMIWVDLPVVQGLAVYLLAVMEFIALTVCVAIAAVRMGSFII